MTCTKQQSTPPVASAYGQHDRMAIAFLLDSETKETALCSGFALAPRPVTIPAPTVQKSTNQSKPCERLITSNSAEQDAFAIPFSTFKQHSNPSTNDDKSGQVYRYIQSISPPNHASAKSVPPKMRPSRPAYSKPQKFFIMYMRVIKDLSWPQIKNDFNVFFGEDRTKGGLTCEYYRIRTEYDMKRVDLNDPETLKIDRETIKSKAGSQTSEFLKAIGYKD